MKSPPVHREPQTISPEIIDKFLTNQSKELQLKAQEIELQKQKDTHSFQYAREALNAKVSDLGCHRAHQQRMQLIRSGLFLSLSLLIAIVIGFALFRGMDEVAIEIIKALAYIGGGAIGGYGAGRVSQKDKAPPDKDG